MVASKKQSKRSAVSSMSSICSAVAILNLLSLILTLTQCTPFIPPTPFARPLFATPLKSTPSDKTTIPTTTNMPPSTSTSSSSSSSSRQIPKSETCVLSLLSREPTSDGRGIKIAIMDTGCDLSAANLRTTSDNRPKYLDFVDGTGDGDVDTSRKVKVENDKEGKGQRMVTGLTGKKLILGEWAEGVEEVRVGAVPLFRLMPRSVKRRLLPERKEGFLRRHAILTDRVQRSLDGLRSSLAEAKSEEKESGTTRVKEAETLLDQLQSLRESYSDPGPTLDLLTFSHNGTLVTVLDTTPDGNLTSLKPMSAFATHRQTSSLGFGSGVTYCVQFYSGGDITSIVTDAGSHGTHVAGIAAAYDPSSPETNGVAPGAQILAIKIGDGRLGSTETGTGLIRGLAFAKKYGCQLLNLSYGEPFRRSEGGRVGHVFSEAVRKWGLCVFTSAGNDGPGLSTVGAPGGLSAVVTVGAYVSPEMAIDQYSTLLPPTAAAEGEEEDKDGAAGGASYYFSSRGPTPDGGMVDLCAPGGAIAPVPPHTLQPKAQYHGTSMSSPNACGVAACVLSALSTPPTVAELKRGLLNTAGKVTQGDVYAQGAGLINAEKAVEYLREHSGKVGQGLEYDVTVPSREMAKGIYIRSEDERLRGPMTFGVLVRPRFDHHHKAGTADVRSEEDWEELLDLEVDLMLRPSCDWIACPERLTLLSGQERGGQSFNVRLDPNNLPPGVHYGTVDAIPADEPARGPLFRLPVTIVVPHNAVGLPKGTNEENTIRVSHEKGCDPDVSLPVRLIPGQPERRFLTIPPSAEWATIRITTPSSSPPTTSPQRMILHVLPFVGGDRHPTQMELYKIVTLTPGSTDETYHVRVKPLATAEFCFQLLWLANQSPAEMNVDVTFHSLGVRTETLRGESSSQLVIGSAEEFARTGVMPSLRPAVLNPKATLSQIRRTVRPNKFKVVAGCEERDVPPPVDKDTPAGSPAYYATITYQFELSPDKDKTLSVTPSIPSLFHQLYDSPLDSQLWMMKDAHGKVLSYGSSMHAAESTSLSQGEYTLTLLLRHPDRTVLEQMKDVPLQLGIALGKADELSCTVYSRLDEASTPAVTVNEHGGDKKGMVKTIVGVGRRKDVYVARPTKDLPGWVAPGDVAVGALVLDKDREGVTAVPLLYQVPPKSTVKKNSSDDDKSKDDEEEETIDDVIFSSKVSYLTKLRTKKKWEEYVKLSATLRGEKPNHIPLITESLTYAKTAPPPEDKNSTALEQHRWRATQISNLINATLSSSPPAIDETAIARYFGINPPSEDDLRSNSAAKKLKKEMTEQRKVLRALLSTQAAVYGSIVALNSTTASSEDLESFDKAVTRSREWIAAVGDVGDDEDEKMAYVLYTSRHARYLKEKRGTALNIVKDARKDMLARGGKAVTKERYETLTKEILGLYKEIAGGVGGSVGETAPEELVGHLIKVEENELLTKFPVSQQKDFM